MNIKIEQNMSISDLPEMNCLDLKKVGLFDRNEKPWSKYTCGMNDSDAIYLGRDTPLEVRLICLSAEEDYLNGLCHCRGHLFLNEVHDRFKNRRTKDGQMMGWVVTKNRKKDRIVEFTVYIDNESIMVDFNMDGNILDIFDYL